MSDSREVLRRRLADAEETLHELQMGRSATSVQHRAVEQGTNMTWTAAQIPELEKYIARLQRQLGILPPRRPLRVIF